MGADILVARIDKCLCKACVSDPTELLTLHCKCTGFSLYLIYVSLFEVLKNVCPLSLEGFCALPSLQLLKNIILCPKAINKCFLFKYKVI